MTTGEPTAPSGSPSSFVTTVAWIFIVLTGFATLVGGMQNLVIRSMPFDQLGAVLQDSTLAGLMPPTARFAFSHFQLIALLPFAFSLFMFISSIGLLKWQNWARLSFVCLLALSILGIIGGLFLQQSLMSSFTTSFERAAAAESAFRANADQFTSMITAMRAFMTVFSLGMAGLFTWIGIRLLSPSIRAEFTRGA